MAPFGINERLVRTSVFRLAARRLARRRNARPARAATASPQTARARFADAYRRIYAPPADDWDGEWELVVAPPDRCAARERATLRDELAWDGLRRARRPACSCARASAARRLPSRLARDPSRDSSCCARATMPAPRGASLAARAAQAWDLRGLAADYRRFLRRFGARHRALSRRRRRARSAAMLRRAHAADPRLPPRAAARSAAARRRCCRSTGRAPPRTR